jgi:hypothetical protein
MFAFKPKALISRAKKFATTDFVSRTVSVAQLIHELELAKTREEKKIKIKQLKVAAALAYSG